MWERSRTNLTDSNLNDANLKNANLLEANLRGANQVNTDFTGATLNGARDLKGQKDDKGELFGRQKSMGALSPTGGSQVIDAVFQGTERFLRF
ncbi:MAG: hypothetical protein Kow0031_23200 [Anaerolineae bacterium]